MSGASNTGTSFTNVSNIKTFLHNYNDKFIELYNVLKSSLSQSLNDAHNISSFVLHAMVIVWENVGDLANLQKKDLVMDMIMRLVSEMDVGDNDKEVLKNCVVLSLSNLIDVLLVAKKGKMYIKKKVVEVEKKGCLSAVGFGGNRNKNIRDVDNGVSPNVVLPDNIDPANILFDQLVMMIQSKTVNVTNIMTVISTAMQLVEQYPALPGDKKKTIVIEIVNKLIAQIPTDDNTRATIQSVADMAMSGMIDLVVGVANGSINIGAIVTETAGWLKTHCCSGTSSTSGASSK
jgi:hypothetical protein